MTQVLEVFFEYKETPLNSDFVEFDLTEELPENGNQFM